MREGVSGGERADSGRVRLDAAEHSSVCPGPERSAAQLIAGASDSAQRRDATGNQMERRAGLQPSAPAAAAGGDGGVTHGTELLHHRNTCNC